MLLSVPKLARYLRARDPEALIAAMTHSSAVAILARAIARKNVKIVATEHSTMSKIVANTRGLKYRLMPTWSRWALNSADHIVAVSGGVADDLAARTAIQRSKFQVIYNPVISDSLYDAAEAPVEHPWFQTGEPPVVVDMDSTEIPVYGQQEQSSYNGHFESNCYHPLLPYNAEGDCVAAKLRPGNVHSAEDWEELLLPEIERQLRLGDDVVFRADAAFARAISALVYRQRAEHAFRRA